MTHKLKSFFLNEEFNNDICLSMIITFFINLFFFDYLFFIDLHTICIYECSGTK